MYEKNTLCRLHACLICHYTHTHTHTHSWVSEPVCDLAKIIMAKVPLMKDWLRNLLFEKHNLFEALLSVCVSAWHF